MGEYCTLLHKLWVFLSFVVLTIAQQEKQFIYNGFQGAKLHLDGVASIHPDGLLQMTNSLLLRSGHAFHPQPIKFDTSYSFSTTFIFNINADIHPGHGLAFVISPTINIEHAGPAEYLGIFNVTNNGLNSSHIFSVELDTIENPLFGDIDGNHVGIDVNNLTSVDSASAAYYSDEGTIISLQLAGGKPIRIWIDYDGVALLMNVTIAPFKHPKPKIPLLSTHVNLSAVILDCMYVGFSSAIGLVPTEHYISGWSWSQIGQAQELDIPKLPLFPIIRKHRKKVKFLPVLLIVIVVLLLAMIVVVAFVSWRKMYEDLREPWEDKYDSHRFSYKDLYVATKGFKNSELLGFGGFGRVYTGVLLSTGTKVAVKRMSKYSSQGIQEFVSEIVSMRRLGHRNLVHIQGYCRTKEELLLVYDYMPNGSLDKFLHSSNQPALSWSHRINIIKGVASALLYLHEEWEQVVIHRDVKASNVLLDADMNARLSDFALARVYDHESNPQSTHVVGTVGYLAPELSVTGKPTTFSDVFAFGIFLLEVACGRHPTSLLNISEEDFVLVDWVYDCWKNATICKTSDPKLKGKYEVEEMELVLKLGLICSDLDHERRPSMRQVVQYLNGEKKLPEISVEYDNQSNNFLSKTWVILPVSYKSSDISLGTLSSYNSCIHEGR